MERPIASTPMRSREFSDFLTPRKTSELLRLFTAVLDELRSRGLIRSTNNPVGDYAEFLVVQALGLDVAEKSTKGFDATDKATRKKFEIKGRRITGHNKSRMLSAIRDLESAHFDYLVGVLFNEDFTFYKACVVPVEVARKNSKYRAHTNAHILELKDSLWSESGVDDITDKIRGVVALVDSFPTQSSGADR
jgi:hypothetical protein